MITKDNLKEVLSSLGFSKSGDIFSKNYTVGVDISVDFKTEKIIYPKEIKKGDETTSNFSGPENFVVLECVTYLILLIVHLFQDCSRCFINICSRI